MNNIVHLKGKILYIYETPKNHHLILKIGCGSNVVSCFATDKRIKMQLNEFSVGDYINISGNIQSSRRCDKDGESIICTQIVFIDSIIPPDYTDKGCFFNRFWLNGTVSEIREHKNCLKITVRTDNEGRISFIPVTFYYPDIRLLNYEVGEKIATEGSIQSVRKVNKDGEYKYFQNYVGSQDKTG